MSSSASTTASYLAPRPPKYMSRLEQTMSVWRDQMVRLAELRVSRTVAMRCAEIDLVIDYTVERIPPQIRSMKLADFALLSLERQHQVIACSIFPADYTGSVESQRNAISQTSRPKPRSDNHSQTPTYTAVKRQRSDMESDGKLTTKIRTQLAQQSQHIILPNTAEYLEMAPAKKQQIMGILNAIVNTYEDLDS